MSEIFRFSKFKNYDFFHARYGRGAVIVAVKKQDGATPQKDPIHSGINAVKIFNTKDQKSLSDAPSFDPVQSIEEKDGFIRVKIKFHRTSPIKTNESLVDEVIERVIPANQVTFEIVR